MNGLKRKRGGTNKQSGFGLLEAIVALTLLATSGLALFSWVQQNMQTAARLTQTQARARLILDAQALLQTVNPSKERTGERQVANLRVTWTSEPLEPLRASATLMPPATGPWLMGLYRVQVRAQDAASGASAEFSTQRIGWRRTVEAGVMP